MSMYLIECQDNVNNMYWWYNTNDTTSCFPTVEEAVDTLIREFFTLENSRTHFCGHVRVFEENGTLWQELDGDKDALFREDDVKYVLDKSENPRETPKTMAELRRYLAEGKDVCLFWYDRAPFTLRVREYTKECFDIINNLDRWMREDVIRFCDMMSSGCEICFHKHGNEALCNELLKMFPSMVINESVKEGLWSYLDEDEDE